MFDGVLPQVPAFFDFVSPVYFDGLGYVSQIAVHDGFVTPSRPACEEYVTAADGYLFIMKNGACTCVSSANVKFLAGQRLGVVERARDGKKEGIRGESVASDSSEGTEQQIATQETPSKSATPKTPPKSDGMPEAAPSTSEIYKPVTAKLPAAAVSPTPAPKRAPQKRGGAW